MGNSESSIKKRLEGKPIVIVIGGGFAGIQVAKALDEHCNVLLFDRKDYFFLNLGALRSSVDTSFTEKIIVPYDKLLRYGYVVHAEVTQISDSGIRVHGREEPIHFDYLVIATGTSYAFPSKVAIPDAKDVIPLYQDSANAIKDAANILIIGGGPVGVELLGEIIHKYPEKKITLVHSHDTLIPGNFNPRLGEEIKHKISKIGGNNVKLITGERVNLDDDLKNAFEHRFISGKRSVSTDKNTVIETDLIFFCGGAKVNSASYSETFKGKVDSNGRLKVNNFFQVEGYEKIFAVGDCSNIPETKMGYYAGVQGTHLGKNIVLHLHGKSMKEYKPAASSAIMIPLGPKEGVSQLPTSSGMIVGSRITSMIKGEKLFTNMYWPELNQKNPKVVQFEKTDDEDISRMASLLKIAEEDARKMIEGLEVANKDRVVDHT